MYYTCSMRPRVAKTMYNDLLPCVTVFSYFSHIFLPATTPPCPHSPLPPSLSPPLISPSSLQFSWLWAHSGRLTTLIRSQIPCNLRDCLHHRHGNPETQNYVGPVSSCPQVCRPFSEDLDMSCLTRVFPESNFLFPWFGWLQTQSQ